MANSDDDAALAAFLEDNELADGSEPLQIPVPADDDEEHDIFQPSAWDICVHDGADWQKEAATAFLHNGFCVLRLPRPLVSERSIAHLTAASKSRLARLHERARSVGIQPKKDIMRFLEVCSRTAGGLRYDMRMWSADDATGALADVNAALATADDLYAGESDDDADDNAHSAGTEPLPTAWRRLKCAVEQWVRPVLSELVHTRGGDTSTENVRIATKLAKMGVGLDTIEGITAIDAAEDGTMDSSIIEAAAQLIHADSRDDDDGGGGSVASRSSSGHSSDGAHEPGHHGSREHGRWDKFDRTHGSAAPHRLSKTNEYKLQEMYKRARGSSVAEQVVTFST